MNTTLAKRDTTKVTARRVVPEFIYAPADDASKRTLWGILKSLVPGRRYRIEFTEYRPRRSDRQNRLYWGLIIPHVQQVLRDTQGEEYDPEQAHEFAKALFLARPVIDKRTGELLATMVGSSAVLSTEQFTDYVEHIRMWCAEFGGVVIPDPSEMVSL